MRDNVCTITANEKVYNAKLDVFTSIPNRCTMHWLSSVPPAPGAGNGVEQGVFGSIRHTPRSLASCSSVTGRKEPVEIMSGMLGVRALYLIDLPTPHTAKTSAASP
jgi:hypothetical protein